MLDTRPSAVAVAGVPILEAGVDWLTITAKPGIAAARMEEGAGWWGQRAVESGAKVGDWRWNGYEGWRAGGVAVGRRPDGTCCRLSGADAGAAWRELVAVGEHVTRLDVQVTIGGGALCLDLARVHEWEVLTATHRRGRPLDCDMRSKNGVSQTLNVGSRQSERYGRIYDKHAEAPDTYPLGAWRYEVEFKGDTAGAVVGALSQAERVGAASVALVHDHFAKRGMHPLFAPTDAPPRYSVYRAPTDLERFERWLTHHVGPTFLKYAAEGHGWRLLHAMLTGTISASDGQDDDQALAPQLPGPTGDSATR